MSRWRRGEGRTGEGDEVGQTGGQRGEQYKYKALIDVQLNTAFSIYLGKTVMLRGNVEVSFNTSYSCFRLTEKPGSSSRECAHQIVARPLPWLHKPV